MKEYQYSIIRRVSRNPKRNREGRGVSQSDLEALRQELAGDQNATVTAVRDDLELVDIASEDMRNRLETAEQALTSKLDSGEFSKWRTGDYAKRQSSLDEELRKKLGSEDFSKWQTGELADALAGKASTVDVQQSARDAIAEAIKRAGEMDKQIKVGGRNLIRNGSEAKRQCGEWVAYSLYKPIEQSEPLTLSFDVVKVEKPPIGGRFMVYFFFYSNFRTYASVKYEEGKKRYSVSVQALDYNYDLYGDKKDYIPDAVFIYPNSSYDSGGGCFTIANVKLERGTVATDWTPAPEDLDDSISKVNTSLTSLASTLLDPEQGEIHKLTSQLTTSAQQAIAEAVKRAGEMDKQIKVGGRNLFRNKYFIGEVASRYNIPFDALQPRDGDNTYTLSLDYKISPEDKALSPRISCLYSNNGGWLVDDSDIKRDGEWHHKEYTIQIKQTDPSKYPIYGWFTDYSSRNGRTIDMVAVRNVKLERGTIATDWTPAPEDVAESVTSLESKLLDPQQGAISKLATLLGKHSESFEELEKKLETTESSFEDSLQRVNTWRENFASSVSQEFAATTTNISNLQAVALTTQQREDLGYLTSALRLKMAGGEGGKKTLEGLALQRYIALSGDNKTVSAYLASSELTAVLKAGVTGFGTLNEREQVAINHDGTGHLGNLHFAGNQIDFKTGRDDAPYLSIGAWDMEPIERFVQTTRVDDTPVSVYSLELSSKRKVYEQTISVANDGTRLTVHIDKLTCDCVLGSYAQLTLDGHTLTTWRGNVKDNDKGLDDGGFGMVDVPYQGENLSYERVVSAGTHKLRLEVVDKSRGGLALDGLTVRRYYDSGRRQSLLTKNGMRFFTSADRYLDVDYRSQIITGYKPIPGLDGELPVYEKNPYIVRIKGGLQVDELDMPGVPLCGASFNEAGTQIKAFGKRAKRLGQNEAQAVYDYGMNAYKVYHSIGNTNYIPIVQVSGWSSNNINWSLTPRVYNVTSEYFVVRILSNNDNPQTKAISYVAFKTE